MNIRIEHINDQFALKAVLCHRQECDVCRWDVLLEKCAELTLAYWLHLNVDVFDGLHD